MGVLRLSSLSKDGISSGLVHIYIYIYIYIHMLVRLGLCRDAQPIILKLFCLFISVSCLNDVAVLQTKIKTHEGCLWPGTNK